MHYQTIVTFSVVRGLPFEVDSQPNFQDAVQLLLLVAYWLCNEKAGIWKMCSFETINTLVTKVVMVTCTLFSCNILSVRLVSVWSIENVCFRQYQMTFGQTWRDRYDKLCRCHGDWTNLRPRSERTFHGFLTGIVLHPFISLCNCVYSTVFAY